MRHLNASEISAEFNKQRNIFTTNAAKSGLDTAVQNLSRLIGDLKTAGMDVELTLFGIPSEQAFTLFDASGMTVPVSGVLRMGQTQRLLAISTKEGNDSTLRVAISEFDIRFNGAKAVAKDGNINGVVRHKSFDLKNDDEALAKLGQEIIRYCARNEAVNGWDVAGAFDNGAKLQKTAPRLAPKNP